jgi:CubicO group peptidase (beta-lactamase class C family)
MLALLQGAPTDSLQRQRVAGEFGVRIDSQLTAFEREGFAGTVLVVRDHRIVLLKGYGLANPATGIRNSAATRFEMNSITKMFTGASILQLAAAGKLRVDDPIERHLGALPPSKRAATIEHLASHTAGLVVAGAPLDGTSRESFVNDIKRTPLETPPGTAYRYTNAGYSLLAAIIETASGQKYEDYLRARIFGPAGMSTAVMRDKVPERDTLFAHEHTGQSDAYGWGTIGAGGVWSTVGDVYKWVVALEGDRVVPANQRALLFSEPKPPSQEAYGWHVRPRTDSTPHRIDKGGGSNTFQSQLLYYPTDRVVIVWATNDLRTRWRTRLNAYLEGAAVSR